MANETNISEKTMNGRRERTYSLPSRSTLRARCTSTVRFQCGRELGGHAEMTDVGLGGLRLTSEVSLKVGAHLIVELSDPRGEGIAELKGKVVWTRETDVGWRVGVKVFEDEDTARLVLGDWLLTALKEQSGAIGLGGRQRVLIDLAMASKDADDRPSVWQRLRPAERLTGVNVAVAAF